ncbi:hypothetical protein LR48_Vigan07g238200 [Vigna angularis]|uniref:Retroviral polymerase SH3-like domain-containing protein n=1 Tax=Phaseolus angularis TaxID=3914 RepID=A0A0L9V0W6_PHAAN|nr:hypothetical protein LR48_Vigan07g238200 [Vigna angularis]
MSPGLDKLSARAIKCVFLGYSRLQKGYRCHSPETKKYFMSANVTFFEQTPYFTSSGQEIEGIQQVLPLPMIASNIRPVSTTQRPSSPEPSSPNVTQVEHPENGESSPSDSSSPSLTPTTPEDDSGWPIALRKGTRSTRNPHPIYNFLSYHRLSPSYCALISSVSSVDIPKNMEEALAHPGW